MKKIKDERLILKNLKNIRTVYFIQTLGIIGILGYDLVAKGIDVMTKNPLWTVFMLTTVIFSFLSINISIDHEDKNKSPKRGFLISFFVVFLISTVFGVVTSFSEGLYHGLIIGAIVFICSIIPVTYVFYLRKKQLDGNLDD